MFHNYHNNLPKLSQFVLCFLPSHPSFDGCTWDYCEDVPIVNGGGYSSEDGYAYQMLGVYEGNIGDVATIWVGYRDSYGNQWLDSIRIIINE